MGQTTPRRALNAPNTFSSGAATGWFLAQAWRLMGVVFVLRPLLRLRQYGFKAVLNLKSL